MKKSFWNHFFENKELVIGLSPMDGVTDQPYRYIQSKYGKPSVIYTEFVSVEGLCHNAVQLLKDFIYDSTQRPIVAQIYGTTPDFFRQVAILVCELGYDGIDINMGCPAKNVAHSGAGAALIETPKLALEIVAATKQGVAEWMNGANLDDCPDFTPRMKKATKALKSFLQKRDTTLFEQKKSNERLVESIPVSVKTRIGSRSKSVDEWIPWLVEAKPAVIAIHGRTLKQAYGGKADWEEIARAKKHIELSSKKIGLLGNGDISSREDALNRIQEFGLDGVLIGRKSFGNPFVFQPTREFSDTQKLSIMVEHAELFESVYQDFSELIQQYGGKYSYSFLPMRKHLGWYVRGMLNAKEMRQALFQVNSSEQVRAVLQELAPRIHD